MTVCFCIDDNNAIAFNSRRQSKDRAQIETLCKRAEGKRIIIGEKSRGLFFNAANAFVDSFDNAGTEDFCFIEHIDPSPYIKKADRVIIYRWNRRYPFDVKLGTHPSESGFSLKESADFCGSSHEKITEEIWER